MTELVSYFNPLSVGLLAVGLWTTILLLFCTWLGFRVDDLEKQVEGVRSYQTMEDRKMPMNRKDFASLAEALGDANGRAILAELTKPFQVAQLNVLSAWCEDQNENFAPRKFLNVIQKREDAAWAEIRPQVEEGAGGEG